MSAFVSLQAPWEGYSPLKDGYELGRRKRGQGRVCCMHMSIVASQEGEGTPRVKVRGYLMTVGPVQISKQFTSDWSHCSAPTS